MTNREDQLETLELTIEQAKKHVELRECLSRLRENKDFQKIIEDGYFKEEASRLVILRASPQGEDNRQGIDEAIVGIGQLRQYFSRIYIFGMQSEKAIQDAEKTREEILQESLED